MDLNNDEEPAEYANYLIGEAVRRAMMGEVEGLSSEIKQIAWDVLSKLAPAVLTSQEFHVIDVETGLYPPDFRTKYADRFRKSV